MYLLMSPQSASSTAATSFRDRLVAAARLFRTSDLLGALTLPPAFAAVGAFAILCHPPCEVHQGIEVICTRSAGKPADWPQIRSIGRKNATLNSLKTLEISQFALNSSAIVAFPRS